MSNILTISVTVPKKIIDKAKELKLDPSEEAEARLELAEKYLDEAKKYMEKGDAVQASEKLYKAVEECIKALAQKLNVPEVVKAREHGRWFTWLLDKAARSVAKVLNEYRIKSAWDAAYSLHVWGFHEAKLSIEDVKMDVPQIEWILKYTERLVKEKKESMNRDRG
jgi:HEPN domain-containing protein